MLGVSVEQLREVHGLAASAQLDGDLRRVAAGRAPDRGALRHLIPNMDRNRAEAGDQRRPALAVIEDDDIAIAAERPGIEDLARGRSDGRSVGGAGERDAAGANPGRRQFAHADDDATDHRQAIGRATGASLGRGGIASARIRRRVGRSPTADPSAAR